MAATAAQIRELMVMVIGLQLSIVGAFFELLSLTLTGVLVTAVASLYEISRWMGFR
ncbi:hypothetical protein [Halosimplex halobium]|uniref:hypothetical protein n=1 Tax=Halosimplex halobium TaxID=3396618 RepID=UPI003F552BA3